MRNLPVISSLRGLLAVHEGRRAHRYRDSLGFWTIGVGHLIDSRKGGSLPSFIKDLLRLRNLDVYMGDPMPEDIIDLLLDYDIMEHTAQLERLCPWVRSLDPVRYAVLADMFFNLGPEPFDGDGVKDWPIFLRQVRAGQYAAAAANMMQTLWAKQVKSRAVRLAKMMETGQWPKE